MTSMKDREGDHIHGESAHNVTKVTVMRKQVHIIQSDTQNDREPDKSRKIRRTRQVQDDKQTNKRKGRGLNSQIMRFWRI